MLVLSIYLFSCFVLARFQENESPEESETKTSMNAFPEETFTTVLTTTDEDAAELKSLDWEVWCKLQPNGNDCTGKNSKTTRYYFDTVLEDCKTFLYGKCSSSFNNFATLSECHESCRDPGRHPLRKSNYSEKVLCRLQPSFGIGYEYHPMFYFDINTRKCRGFSFSGVGGNGNRFPSSQICSATCLRLMEPELTI